MSDGNEAAAADGTKKIYTGCLILIGNELLSGRIQDANLAFLGKELNELGIRLAEARVISDDEGTIVDAVNTTRARYDYVFTSGGIGPTHDDITTDSVAKAFGLEVEQNPEAVEMLLQHYQKEDLNEARLRMARIPLGATLLENPLSKAPGFRIENVFVMAGVPRIFQAKFHSFKHMLVGGKPVRSLAISAFITESVLAADLTAIQEHHPEVEIGSYIFVRAGKAGVSLVLRHPEDSSIAVAAEEVREMLRNHGVEPMDDEGKHASC